MQVGLSVSLFLPVVFLAGVLPAFCDAIPYAQIGQVAPPSTIMTAATGPLGTFFYGFSAGDADSIKVIDTTAGLDGGWFFDNRTTAAGASLTVPASVNAADILEFQLLDRSTGDFYSSIPAHSSSDGINHFYFTPYTGGVAGLPAGLFIGGEDRPLGNSDLDYNDDQFAITNVRTTTIAEPASMALAGIGLLVAGLLIGMRAAK